MDGLGLTHKDILYICRLIASTLQRYLMEASVELFSSVEAEYLLPGAP